ncbi:MAG: 7TM-DISM domain-containing protein, partial [Spirochaetia bacterium]|nr:7TM-DISM domain-containing protein [Spirochaetia bacterium]
MTRLDFLHSIADLNGSWAFWFGITEEECRGRSPSPDSRYVTTPAYWSAYSAPGVELPSVGRGCYSQRVRLDPEKALASHLTLYVNDVSAASVFYWNGTQIGAKGILGSSREEEHGHIGDAVFVVPAGLIRSENILTIAVSNHVLRGGGINNEIFLGGAGVLTERRTLFRMIDFFLLGSIIMAGIYYLALWMGRPQQKAYLWFLLMCLVVSLRLFSSGSYFEELVGNPRWMTSVRMHIEYLTAFSLDAIAFAFFLRYLFPGLNTRIVRWIILTMGTVPALVVLGTRDAVVYGRYQPYFSLMLGVGLVCSMYIFVLAVVRREVGARFTFASFLIMFAAALHDLIMTSRVENVRLFAPFGVFVFIYGMAAALGRQFNQVHLDLEVLSESYARFVPREFLRHLNKRQIIDVRLGDNT